MSTKIIYYLTAIFLYFQLSNAAISKDRITSLPGLSSPPSFRQYSGYLNGSTYDKLFYWFVESQNNPSSDPVVLWLNGGPGCSSLSGFLMEHGPFLAIPGTKNIKTNKYSWNKFANVLYLEAPKCVGFSYSEIGDCSATDDSTSLSNYNALVNFFQNYPEFSQNSFYITGESYGGMYIPTLSVRIKSNPSINFKGVAIGNGLSNDYTNNDGFAYGAYYHGMISDSNWTKILDSCCSYGEDRNRCSLTKNSENSNDCQQKMAVFNEIGAGGFGVSPYDIYGPCISSYSSGHTVPHQSVLLLNSMTKAGKERAQYWKLYSEYYRKIMKENVESIIPCQVDNAAPYLNRADVKKAIHVSSNAFEWSICSSNLQYQRQYSDMKQFYNKLFSYSDFKILIYNGDTDLVCSYLADEWFFEQFNQEVTLGRIPWYYKDDRYLQRQVGGYVKQFEKYALITIRGAGHTVPMYKPRPSLAFYEAFLNWAGPSTRLFK